MYAPPMLATLAQMMKLRPLSVDDLSAARYIHATAFAGAARNHYSPADIDAFTAFIRSPRYADLLLGNHAVAACIGSEMVGTAAWSAGEPPSPTARILAVFVRPMFTGDGIGRQLVGYIEEEARGAGYQALEVSATLNAVGFFQDLGYLLVREGAWALPLGHEMPVAFMRKASFVALQAAH
jgi:GNAT superfamily N-acetyltransferase